MRAVGRDRLTWAHVRFVGKLPLFGVSYLALAALVLFINVIEMLNDRVPYFVSPELISYPIAVPLRSTVALVAAAALVIGTTIYRLACPPRIQEYSATTWRDELRRPLLLYLGEATKRRVWQLPALALTVGGGLIGLLLLGERVALALSYSLGL